MTELADRPGATPVPRPAGHGSLSLSFANTRHAVRGRVQDGIGTPELLRTWLSRHADELGLPGAVPRVDRADVVAFVELRDAVCDLFSAAVRSPGQLVPEEHIALLNRVSAGAPRWPSLVRVDGEFQVVERTAGDPGRRALAAPAQDAIMLLGGELLGQLRACGAPGCVRFFLKDHPRREWCSPACGNRARAARHYQRRSGNTGMPAPMQGSVQDGVRTNQPKPTTPR